MGADPRSDEELVELVKQGSVDSFQVLYERYKTKIYNYLYHFLGDRHGAEDCTHDLFIQLYQKVSLYSPSAKFSSWLYRMARNLALDTLRRRKIRRASSFDAATESQDPEGESSLSLADRIESGVEEPGSAMASEELKEHLRRALMRLSEKDRQIVLLCDIQGLPHKEVGDILGYPAKTVTVKLYRARQRLAQVIGLKKEDL